ncbi:MAG: hypothetical protein HC781_09605 [Leptolyngbyaceae cyanobacterium CSU_1_4]|nr:hypothetical protein [Leptolyngbyaceae cyanobacterium CSU_1_4]
MQTWLSSGTRFFPAFIAPMMAGISLSFPAPAQLQAQALPGFNTIFENVTLSPSFSPDPAIVRGISGGEMSANDVATRTETATGACTGFVDEQPDHTIVLTSVFNFLNLQVESPEDTTLVIRGPGGTWCNDDYTGKNPGIAGQWLSGTYQIWVGSYRQDEYSPYVIRMTAKK